MHRDPRYFSPLPDTFWPDRWLPAEERSYELPGRSDKQGKENIRELGPSDVILEKAAFIPFSFGPSGCVGKSLAYQEIRMVVSLLMQTFDMRLAEGYNPQQWEKDIEDRFIAHKGTLPVVCTSRRA